MAASLLTKIAQLTRAKVKVPKKAVIESGVDEGGTYTPILFNPYYDATHLRTNSVEDTMIEAQKYDSDFSHAIWAVTRFSSTDIDILFMNKKGEFDAKKTQQFVNWLRNTWLSSVDKPDVNELADNIIMELFMQGGIGIELVLDELKQPSKFVTVPGRVIDWEKKNGTYIPYQRQKSKKVYLNIPTFFFVNTDRRPDQAVADSPLLSAVQAVTFKQTVINDIQRVIRRAGYPRHKVTILEEILTKNAPNDIRLDPAKMSVWLKKQKEEIASTLSQLNPEDAIVIFDSVQVDYLSTNGNSTVDFGPIVDILTAQLTSALKVLPSILGKASSGSMNIASVESMTFVKTLTFLQERCDKILSQAFTLSARLLGMQGYIVVKHNAINLRPELELEPQKLAKQNRVMQLQSYGHITDSEAALQLGILHEPKEPLSGTQFLTGGPTTDTENISPNVDPLGRSITGGDGAGDTKGNKSSS